jgi:hypothetical protein
MSKSYIQDLDVADSAAAITYIAANPTQFTKGTIVSPVDGDAVIVTSAGVASTITTIA